MRRIGWAAVGLVSLAACGGGGTTKAAKPTTTGPTGISGGGSAITVALGHDRATTPFCITMTQLTNMQNPADHPAEAQAILDDAVSQAPPEVRPQMQALAAFLRGTLSTTPTTALDATTAGTLLGAFTTVGTYASQHCGIVLKPVGQ